MIEGVNDSKKVSEKKREELYEIITKEAISYGVGIIDQKEIDRIVDKYDELNNAGIRITNFKFLSNVLIKNIILALIFVTVQ